MRLNTIITLGASATFGLMAVFLARGWVNDAVENQFRQVKPAIASEIIQQINTVPVVVADLDIAFGDSLSYETIRLVNYPEDAVPTGAFTDLETLLSGESDRIALSALSYNEPILESKITGPNGKASLSARIRPGYRAVSVRVDDVSGVAGFVVPGDIVDIIYTREPEKAANARLKVGAASSAYISDIILQNITVLGVDQNQSEAITLAGVARTVTLEVINEDAQALSLAMEYGTLSLSLRGAGETSSDLIGQMKLSDLGAQKPRSYKKVVRRSVVKRQEKSKAVNVADITVIRSEPNAKETVERLSVKRDDSDVKKSEREETRLFSELAGE